MCPFLQVHLKILEQSLQTVLELGPTVPLFGVCIGFQCIGEAFGQMACSLSKTLLLVFFKHSPLTGLFLGMKASLGKIVRSPFRVMHGKSSLVYYDEKRDDGLLAGLSNPFAAVRYHSLVIEKDSFPSEALKVTARTEDRLIMAARHKKYKHLQGIQFHPESIITSGGKTLVPNFIKMIEIFHFQYCTEVLH